MRKKLNFGILLSSLTVIAYFSLKTAETVPGTGSLNFSFLHFLAYFVLAGSFLLHFHDNRIGHLYAAVSAVVFGLLMELIQIHVQGRFFSVKDIGLNLAGASLVMLDHRSRFITEIIELEDQLLEKVEKAVTGI